MVALFQTGPLPSLHAACAEAPRWCGRIARTRAAGCRGGRHTAIGVDPPLLVPWSRIGGIALGESKARVEREYGSEGHGYHVLVRNNGIVQGYYRLHGSRVFVTFQDGRVNELEFATRAEVRRLAHRSQRRTPGNKRAAGSASIMQRGRDSFRGGKKGPPPMSLRLSSRTGLDLPQPAPTIEAWTPLRGTSAC